MKRMSKAQLDRIAAQGGEVRRTPKPPVKAKTPEQKIETPMQFPHYPEIPDYSGELKQLVKTLGEKLVVQSGKPRRPWRIKVNRDSRGLAETYDVIPIGED